jgi:hypothetical protein
MKYKVGDKVKIKSLEWYNTNKNDFGLIFCNNICFDEKMIEFCGKTVTIVAQRDNKYYYIKEDNCLSFWSEDMIEGLADEPQEKMVSLEDVCKFLDEHLYTGTSTGDYDYGQEYIYSDFDNASDLIFALRKVLGE